MSNPTLKQMVERLEKSIEKMGTMAAHQAILLGLLEEECDSPEQGALLFSLASCNSTEFDWRLEVDRGIAELKALLESVEVSNV